MTKIPIITQNFSSPDAFSATPLMLLPQAPSPPLSDRDQEGFSQLILHDLHRHRQTYLRSYTAFETLKKRQDFVLRQENLRSLQNFEQRITTKQDQYIDQSVHSYEQCFVKIINGNLTTNGNVHEPPKHLKSAATPSFDKFHLHQLSHVPATSLDPPPIIPFNRYQKSHRPPLPSKYRSKTTIYRSAQSLHDAFHSSSFSHQSQPFISFTEGYLQKYNDRSSNKFHNEIYDIKEKQEDEDEQQRQQQQQQIRSASAVPNLITNQNRKQEQKPKTSDLQHIRANMSSRNTNTPSSTPQLDYNDALRDGLTTRKDHENHNNNISTNHEKRPSSQRSTSQISNSDSKTSRKRSKTLKKKQLVVNLTAESSITKTIGNDLLKTAMHVQNYESNSTNQNLSSKIERLQIPTNTTWKTPSIPRRSSIRSNGSNLEVKQFLDNVDTQMTPIAIQQTELIITNNKEQILVSITNNNIIETKQDTNDQSRLEFVDSRKRIKKGAFDASEAVNDMVAFELGMMGGNRGPMKKNRFRFGKENNTNRNEDGTEAIPENQETLDLLEKIRESSSGLAIGQPPLSQQSCRFELPSDLRLLENLTPLEYLNKYCRLSARRNYQFKRIFDKYRNNQYRFESTNLYTSIIDIHTESFTRSQYDYLCQLIDLGNEQHQFTFDTYAGILALCERILYESSKFRSGLDEHDSAKDTLEQCDFDSLDRKFDGLIISETMKRLLKTL